MAGNRPNVFLILTDQHQAQALGAVDGSFHTPALDGLAADGARFENAYCTQPQCSPSRSSIVTGQFPHQTGVQALSNWGPHELDTASNSVGRTLQDAGYETLWSGRWDLGVENATELGWKYTRNLDITGTDGTSSLECDRTTATEVSRYLREYDGDTPFFATASFNLPHPPYFEDECFQQYYDREEVSLPTNFNDDLSTKPAFHRERAKAEECDLSEDEYREVAYRYRTMVSRVDAYIGVVLDTLRSEGLYDDTVIVFTADHGDMQAAHGLNKKGVLAYEEILRVPLVVHHPQLDIERNVIPDFVSTAAVPGTIVEAAGESVSQAFTGGSLLPTMERSSPPDDDRVFFEHNVAYWGHHPYRGVRTPDWKLVEYPKDGEGELYDMQTDADELTNRYNDPDYITVREALENTIERWWNATDGDMDDWITEPDLSFSP